MDLNGKNVIYIGGFGGIGQKCLAELLKKQIKHLAIFDLKENEVALQELRQSFSSAKIFFVKLDITDKGNIETAYKDAIGTMGHIDVVVNGSGVMNDRHVDLTIQINLLGVIHSTLTAVSHMDKAKGGCGGIIVNISSVVGLEPSGMFAVYSASKTGVTAFTRGMSNPCYYEHTGICFITICPGFTDTPILESPNSKATLDYAEPILKRFLLAKRQTAETCARNLVKAIELAKNGSVWLLDNGEMKEVEFPVLWKPALSNI